MRAPAAGRAAGRLSRARAGEVFDPDPEDVSAGGEQQQEEGKRRRAEQDDEERQGDQGIEADRQQLAELLETVHIGAQAGHEN